VLRSPKLLVGLAAGVVAALGAWTPAVSASTCDWQVKTAGGLEFNVPLGVPISQLVPANLQVLSVTEVCSSGTTTTTSTGSTGSTGSTTTSSSTSSSSSSTTTTTSTQSPPTGKPGGQEKSSTSPSPKSSKSKPPSKKKKNGKHSKTTPTTNTKPKPQTKTSTKGEPSPSNPTYTLALPGAAPLGVPNFFIDSFQIPPALLPIYQAAGIQYNVPWQVLAAINWIETDYGRDLSVSSAGAVGWMQFLPSTFKRWGVDATGSGYADPYNPTDAIFTAARYLAAAGASKDLSGAIFAYNHAGWYVQSVLLRAQLIGGMPAGLISSLTNLVEGHFPVAATATYADDSVLRTAGRRIKGTNAAIPVDSSAAQGTNIYAKVGSPVIAVNDGKVVGIGHTAKLGNFVKLQDDEGNTYTYSQLGSLPKLYPVPKPVHTSKRELAQEVSGTGATATATATASPSGARTATATTPAAAASAGLQPDSTLTVSTTTVPVAASPGRRAKQRLKALLTVTLNRHPGKSSTAAVSSTAKERLFANPTRPASFAAGGEQQLQAEGAAITNFQNYFSDVLHLAKDQYTLAPLTRGSIVVAGTVLGRIGAGQHGRSPHLYFQIQPASSKATFIDPKPVLDGWKLLEATSIYRASGLNPFLSSGQQATIGQILLESKSQLQEEVLKDPRVSIYQCGRRDIQSGAIDRRILATMEFLAASGLDPTISGLKCGAGTSGIDAAGQTGASMDISAINNISIAGHSGSGSVADITIRRLLTLQGAMSPAEIISAISYKGQANTLALPDHRNRIQVTFTPEFGSNRKLTQEVKSILKPEQWIQLINHISQIPEPSVPTARSAYAVKTSTQ
jgi:hypothetical protein